MAGITVREFLTTFQPILALHERNNINGTNKLTIEITSGYYMGSTVFCTKSREISLDCRVSEYYLFESFHHAFLGKQVLNDKGKSELKIVTALDLKVDEWSLTEEDRDDCGGYNMCLKIKIDDKIEKQHY